MKKGQIMGQPFMMIFFVILAAFIIFFGFKMIRGVVNIEETAEFETFITEFKGRVSTVYSLDYGSSVKLDKLSIPANLKKVCFIHRDSPLDYSKLDDSLISLVEVSYENTEDNMFFVTKDNSFIEPREIDNIKPVENPLCDNVMDGKLDFVLVNSGNIVQIEKII